LGILEAAAAALPLLITTECHFPQVRSEGAGIVVHPTVEALNKGLQRMSTISGLKRRLFSRQARKLIDENYSMHSISAKLCDVYTQVLRNVK
jgi:glycosyltransferase involved in cell wall biosynthesis